MPSASKPNVLLIIADDHQADAIAALGHTVVKTPELDQLVASGASFLAASTMGSLIPAVCSPSRACLFSGRDVFRACERPEVSDSKHAIASIAEDAITLPQCFRAQGYETFITGKWHNDVPSLLRSFESGRNIFHGGMSDHHQVAVRDLADFVSQQPPRQAHGFSTEVFCQTAASFLRNRSQDRPFFLCLALTSPHDPRTPPDKYASMYPPEAIPLPESFRSEPDFDNGELDIRDERLLPKPLDPDQLRVELARYYGMISHQDFQIGSVLRALEAIGERENTLIAYVSDHGLALGRHGLLGKQNLYEHSIRVPMILSGPGVEPRVKVTGIVYALDLFATLCELAKVPRPAGLESQDLTPMFSSPALSPRDTVYSLYKDVQRAISDGEWKLIQYLVRAKKKTQLFNLRNDPAERMDLSECAELESKVADLQLRLQVWQDHVGDTWMPRENTKIP